MKYHRDEKTGRNTVFEAFERLRELEVKKKHWIMKITVKWKFPWEEFLFSANLLKTKALVPRDNLLFSLLLSNNSRTFVKRGQ